jgi:DNA-directed RNA polymerase specialized sigma subunit
MLGIIQASRRYSPERGSFRPYARNYANGEVFHFLRDKGFLIKAPPSWRDVYARGKKLIRLGAPPSEVHERLGISKARWAEIADACNQKIISYETISRAEALSIDY